MTVTPFRKCDQPEIAYMEPAMPALTFSDAALLGREAQLRNTGGTQEKYRSSTGCLPREQLP
jgi:hypothetical protein